MKGMQRAQAAIIVKQGLEARRELGAICDDLEKEFGEEFYWRKSGEDIVFYHEVNSVELEAFRTREVPQP